MPTRGTINLQFYKFRLAFSSVSAQPVLAKTNISSTMNSISVIPYVLKIYNIGSCASALLAYNRQPSFLMGIRSVANKLIKPKFAKIQEKAIVVQRKTPNLAKN